MFERIIYILVLFGFFILSGIGVYFGNDHNTPWTEWITEKGRWVLLLANALFLVLAFRQLLVWNIYPGKDQIQLKRFLGLRKIVLRKDDFVSFTVEIDKDAWWMKNPRTTVVIRLQTTKGKVVLNASDYKSFDDVLTQLFSLNNAMRLQCLGQISRLKTRHRI